MPKCKICGEAVQSGEVMHVECREKWEKELLAKAEAIRERATELEAREREIVERRNNLDYREYELLFREREADEAMSALEWLEKTNTWLCVMDITLGVLLIIISLSKILG